MHSNGKGVQVMDIRIRITVSEAQVEALERLVKAEDDGSGFALSDAQHQRDVLDEIVTEYRFMLDYLVRR